MYACMHLCVYLCIYVCVQVRLYVCMHVRMYDSERNLIASVATNFQKGKVTGIQRLDNELATQAKETCDIEKVVDNLTEAVTTACKSLFRFEETNKKWTKCHSVPWWTKLISTATVLKPGGYYTSNLNETARVILDHLITEDDRTDGTNY